MGIQKKLRSVLMQWSYSHKKFNKNLLNMKRSVDELKGALNAQKKKK